MTRPPEPQTTKSRSAMLAAFRRLLMARPYHDIHVPDIIREADVSRSTFYGHFQNKNDILRASLSGVISTLSKAGFPELDAGKLIGTLNHFRANSDLSRICLNTPISALAVELLAEQIKQRLDRRASRPGSHVDALASKQIAEASIGLIRAWINDPVPATSTWVAGQLDASVRALSRLAVESPPPSV